MSTPKACRQIALEYFAHNPQAREGIMKAYYAYHVKHFRCDPKAHNFNNYMLENLCIWCGRSRSDVRWDDLPPECAQRPTLPEIKDAILSEETKAFALLNRADKIVPKVIGELGLNGQTLAILHHTHGYDPETVGSIVDVSSQMLAEYHLAMDNLRATNRR